MTNIVNKFSVLSFCIFSALSYGSQTINLQSGSAITINPGVETTVTCSANQKPTKNNDVYWICSGDGDAAHSSWAYLKVMPKGWVMDHMGPFKSLAACLDAVGRLPMGQK